MVLLLEVAVATVTSSQIVMLMMLKNVKLKWKLRADANVK